MSHIQARRSGSLAAAEIEQISEDFGIVMGASDWLRSVDGDFHQLAMDAAQPQLITNANAGIPSYLTTLLDPKLVQVLVAPNKAAQIAGREERKGDWVTDTIAFAMIENTGEVSSYGDWNTNGRAGANFQFENRQSYVYQTTTEWGERQLARAGLAKIDWSSSLNISSALILNKFQNLSYFFGIDGLANYGLLNDPSLSAPITPVTKTAGGTSWANALPTEIARDVQKMFAQLQSQVLGIIDMDAEMTLAIAPISEVYLMNTNDFGMQAWNIISTMFKNLKVISAIQYQNGTVYSGQLIVKEIDGQETVYCAYNEKMRAHRVIADLSSFKQKKTQGTWGAIIQQPMGIAQIIGI